MKEILNSKFNISKKISIAFTKILSLAFTMMLFLIIIGCTDNSNLKNNSSITSSDFISESQVNNSTLIESNFELASSEVQKQTTTEKAAAEKAAAEKAAAEKAAAEKAKRIREIDNEISLKKNQIEENNQQISDFKGARNYYQSLLNQALSDLSYARNNKIKVYVSGVGWIYQTDQNAISAAESRVNTYKSYVNQCDENITSLNESNNLLKRAL